ncbi:hypothetical protein DRO59_10355 [Candidatus Bathyarchaeota archaeon]|nr:MAG: hypothetical protein DRO59_10355 [Candidatus Bathyarchaeota archaeon]
MEEAFKFYRLSENSVLFDIFSVWNGFAGLTSKIVLGIFLAHHRKSRRKAKNNKCLKKGCFIKYFFKTPFSP